MECRVKVSGERASVGECRIGRLAEVCRDEDALERNHDTNMTDPDDERCTIRHGATVHSCCQRSRLEQALAMMALPDERKRQFVPVERVAEIREQSDDVLDFLYHREVPPSSLQLLPAQQVPGLRLECGRWASV